MNSLPLQYCLVEVDVRNPKKARRVRDVARQMKPNGFRIFVCPPGDHDAVTQARSLGSTHIVDRADEDPTLLRFLGDIVASNDPPASAVVGAVALDLAFGSILESKELPEGHLESVAATLASDVSDLGIDNWLHSIRSHHAGTYQHCLIVTGLASAFGQFLGLSAADLEKLTVAALLHDVGKARIDLAILDKAGRLTPEERKAIEMHPVWGEQHLRQHGTVAEEILDVVRHHHEYLDGSGYPDRLRGSQITDLTRLLTIVDIFGALIERRSYKPPMSGEAAYGILTRMADEGKLEKALVQAFKPVAAQIKDEQLLDSA